MNRFKDFIYNKNDIIIVLIILAVAGLLIYSRVGVIMDYPEKIAAENAAAEATQEIETTEPQPTEEPEQEPEQQPENDETDDATKADTE